MNLRRVFEIRVETVLRDKIIDKIPYFQLIVGGQVIYSYDSEDEVFKKGIVVWQRQYVGETMIVVGFMYDENSNFAGAVLSHDRRDNVAIVSYIDGELELHGNIENASVEYEIVNSDSEPDCFKVVFDEKTTFSARLIRWES